MNSNARSFASRMIAALVCLIMPLPTLQAADLVQWSELPRKVGSSGKGRRYKIVTRAGAIYVGPQLFFRPDSVSLTYPGPEIPREDVAEIRISRHGSFFDAVFAPGGAITDQYCNGMEYCFTTWLLLIPFAVGATAVAAPIILPIEGIKRLLPDKVIKVAP